MGIECVALNVSLVYNALPAEIRAIRGYKRYVSALKNLCMRISFTLRMSILLFELLLSYRFFPRVNFNVFFLYISIS